MLLKKLDFLMSQKNINKNVLAKESGIPYTTIDGLYKKGYENVKLSTLKKICSYFDVTLDFLVCDDIFDVNYGKEQPQFSAHELDVISAYISQPEMQSAVNKLLGIKSPELEPFNMREHAEQFKSNIEKHMKPASRE